MLRRLFAITSSAALAFFSVTPDADACGCFAPPDVATPVVQAGEQIVFAHDGTNVTMHVQVEYDGPASQFGWLLPVPAIPEIGLSTEELFSVLDARTSPVHRVEDSSPPCGTDGSGQSRDAAAAIQDGGGGQATPPEGVLIERHFVGPYEAAVLDASDQSKMLEWLNASGFFIPDALGTAVGPYVHEGAYFVALKLQKDQQVGDIAPISLTFEAELPMIPLILTRVGATQDMPITAFVLGDARAIPRNFRHTILNDEHIDWFSNASNYDVIVTRAVDEAANHHSFVTEYAGPGDFIGEALAGRSRFGVRSTFEELTDAGEYVALLRFENFAWTSPLQAILREAIPYPPALLDRGVTEEAYYGNIVWYLTTGRERAPEAYEGVDLTVDPIELTEQIWNRVVIPTRAAAQLFEDNAWLTRLYTTLSPDEMTVDPVFAFNPDLPEVSRFHAAKFARSCDASLGELELPDGRIFTTNAAEWPRSSNAPYSARIELLREEGAPEVEVDNAGKMTPGGAAGLDSGLDSDLDAGCGCRGVGGAGGGGLLVVGVLVLLAVARRRGDEG